MRIVFMGTPDFAAASLQKLIEEDFEIVGVFTQPDKPKGRGMELSFSPVKTLALQAGLPVYQPEKMRDGTAMAILRELQPEILVVVAYGKILPDEMLALPRYGAINVHGSLLPQYRGAAPINWAIINGERETGVTTFMLNERIDEGGILLMAMGAELLVRTLRDIEAGTAPRTPQDHSRASYVKMLDKSLCPIDWNRTPREIVKQIYGLQPWPVATMELEGKTYRVFGAAYTDGHTAKAPGTIVAAGIAGIEIACANGETLCITELQAPGKKRMAAADFLRGHPLKVGTICR